MVWGIIGSIEFETALVLPAASVAVAVKFCEPLGQRCSSVAPSTASVRYRRPKNRLSIVHRYRRVGFGRTAESNGVVRVDGVGRDNRRSGRRGIVGEGQRRAAGKPGGIGLAGGDGLAALRQAGRGERPHPAGIGRRGAEHG